MWQRKQTLFFGIAIILVSIPLIGLTFFSYTLNQIEYHVTAFGIENMTKPKVDGKIYFVSMLVLLLVLFMAIISFKNRKRQISLSWLALVLHLSTLSWMSFMSYNDSTTNCTDCQSTSIVPGIGFYLFLTAFLFIVLGYRGVQKDKALIDSLNRLR